MAQRVSSLRSLTLIYVSLSPEFSCLGAMPHVVELTLDKVDGRELESFDIFQPMCNQLEVNNLTPRGCARVVRGSQ